MNEIFNPIAKLMDVVEGETWNVEELHVWVVLCCPPCELLWLWLCPVKCSFSVLWAPIWELAWRVSGCGLLVLWALRAALTCHSCPSTLENSLEVQPKVGNCFSSNQQNENENLTPRLRAPKGPWTSSLTQRHTSSSF